MSPDPLAPENFPSYRPPSRKHAPGFASKHARARAAGAFTKGARTYEDVRPGYPDDVAELVKEFSTVLDIGAGTGKLTQSLHNKRVLALDPSADMAHLLAQRLGIPVWQATAESTAVKAASVDAVTCAQTWHWVDVERACAELDRIIRPHGVVLLVWNTIDVAADPWVLRLTRIMHSGDIHKEGFSPEVADPWKVADGLHLKWQDHLTPAQLHQLMHTRSYWLKANPATRARMTHNLNWYLDEHMGFAPEKKVSLPYRTDAFLLTRG